MRWLVAGVLGEGRAVPARLPRVGVGVATTRVQSLHACAAAQLLFVSAHVLHGRQRRLVQGPDRRGDCLFVC